MIQENKRKRGGLQACDIMLRMNDIQPETTEKPWGSFRRFTLNELSTVKVLHVRAGEEFSLQHHGHRAEFWRVLKGSPSITIGDATVIAKEGDEFTVPAKTNHRIAAEGSDAEILEISLGEFDEGDIERVEDKYGRA